MEVVTQESFSEALLDGGEDCNWCTLTEDGIKGPFSANEIRQKFNEKKLQTYHRIWHKKSASWIHVSAILHLLQEPKPMTPQIARPLMQEKTQETATSKDELAWLQKVSFAPQVDQGVKTLSPSRRLRLAATVGVVVSLGITMITMGTRFSLPLNEIKRLSSSDQTKAHEILTSSSFFADLRAEVFLLPDSGYNQFLVALNLPQKQQMILKVTGKPETLTDTFMAQFQTSFQIGDKATVISLQPEKRAMMLPKGNYVVSLVCSNCGETNAKEIFKIEMFLGGAQDNYYAANLKRYHAQLRAQASEELNYLKQLTVGILKLGQIKSSKEFQEEKQVIMTEIESLEADVAANKYFYAEFVNELRLLINESFDAQLSPEAKSNFVRKIDDLLGRFEFLMKASLNNEGFPKRI